MDGRKKKKIRGSFMCSSLLMWMKEPKWEVNREDELHSLIHVETTIGKRVQARY